MLFKWSKIFLKRTPAPRRHGQRGATAVEMALLAPTFFTLLIGLTESGLMWTAQQMLESAAYNTSRLAKTGYADAGKSQLDTVMSVLNNQLSGFGTFIDVTQVSMSAKTYTSFSNISVVGAGTEGLGAAQEIVVYTVTYPWKLFTPMMDCIIGTSGFVNLTARIVVRNEPYS